MTTPRWTTLIAGAALCVAALAAPDDGTAFKDWVVRCGDAAAGARRCFLVQNIALKDSGEQLLNVQIGTDLANGEPGALITLPLGILLPAGIALSVDDGKPVRFAVQQCVAKGCIGVLRLGEDLVAQMKAGRQAQVRFADIREGKVREIGIPVSLLGFTAGYQALSQ